MATFMILLAYSGKGIGKKIKYTISGNNKGIKFLRST